MEEKPHTICEGSRREIDPDGPDTIKAFALVPAQAMGKPVEMLEGIGVLFHEACFIGPPRYKRA